MVIPRFRMVLVLILIFISGLIHAQEEIFLVSMSISSGTVTRTNTRFHPTATLVYSDGRVVYCGPPAGSTLTQDSDRVIYVNGYFDRRSKVLDGVVTCHWSYEGRTATSTVTVVGQLDNISVNDGTVTRTERFYPTITAIYTDGSTDSFSTSGEFLVSQNSDVAVYHPLGLPSPYFDRRPEAADGEVLCQWSHSDGVTKTATSKVTVLGQLASVSVDDGTVTRTARFYPWMTVTFTDGTSKDFDAGGRLVSQSLDLVIYEIYSVGGTYFHRRDQAPDGEVLCQWSYSDGVTKTATSKVTVLGQLASVSVDNGTVTRTEHFPPWMTVTFTDGTTKDFSAGSRLVSQSSNIIIYQQYGWPHPYFERRSEAADGEVLCQWSYSDGVTKTATSKVTVLGQLATVSVTDGSVKRSGYFYPWMTVTFTDGTSKDFGTGGRLVSQSSNFATYNAYYSRFERRAEAPNGIVKCKWTYFDGVTVYGDSKVTVSGGSNGDLEYNNGKKTDPEVAYNSSSKNKDNTNNKSSSSCLNQSNICSPCGNTSAKVQGKSDNGNYQDGDPVNINNLEVVEEAIDMEIPGRGMSFQFKRTYRSRIIYPSCYGFNWSHNYDRRFVPHPEQENVVVFYNGYARGDAYYVDSGSGNLIPPEYHFRKVIKDSDNSLLMRNNDGMILKFYPLDASAKAGHLAAIITRCGNRMTFAYNSDGQISTVYDSLSRPINYYYNSEGMLEKIADFTGREVRYYYNTEGDLIQVTSPAVTGTPNGNDFPEGKSVVYTYSSGYDDIRLNHNLLTITRPNEVASNGPPSVVNFYDADDRLISQQWGGTNSSGISAGGTISYARQEVNTGVDPDNATLPREVVTIIDRNGNERVYYYNNHHNLIKKEEKNRGIRAGDPAAFVTQYQYTDTGLLKEEIRPLGDRTVYTYDENNPDQLPARQPAFGDHLPRCPTWQRPAIPQSQLSI